jgi:hypothetical protein
MSKKNKRQTAPERGEKIAVYRGDLNVVQIDTDGDIIIYRKDFTADSRPAESPAPLSEHIAKINQAHAEFWRKRNEEE